MKRLVCAIAILTLLLNMALAQTTPQAGAKKNNKETGSNPQAAAATSVSGGGTAGRLSKWVGTSGSSTFVLGDTIITEDKFGKIGIGTATPTSPLTVQGMIETTMGGYKFPDGTLQTTALSANQVVSSLNNLKGNVTLAAGANITIMPSGNILTIAAPNALTGVAHNTTLQGNGTSASPLGVAIPLNLSGSVSPILSVQHNSDFGRALVVDNNSFGGVAVSAVGGRGTSGAGVLADGGSSGGTDAGGAGVVAHAGRSNGGPGGTGVFAAGGDSSSGNSDAGTGVLASGGLNDNSGKGGDGVRTFGGISITGASGAGVRATGGDAFDINASAGDGVVATGGDFASGTTNQNRAGNGVVATGGNNPSGVAGIGVVATGGHVGGAGVFAVGSNETSGNNSGGNGVGALGGIGSGASHSGGNGITAVAGPGLNGASIGLAGHFIGSVLISGDLNVQGTKNFKIDHPLDPENKYLLHAAIESSEVLNIYSGNVTTNKNGEAIVTLPPWFEAMNKDLRYQLTVIGTFAQAIVSEKVKQNRFVIETNAANVEVSWQVTGVRSDAAMLKHPFKAEEDKPVRERRLSRP